jgi:LysR family transcriptional activator of nhaA
VPSLSYRHLRYFRAIAHEGQLTRAAERLSLSPSALSVQLKALELQLGHALFDRIGKRLVLTEAGRIALDYADSIFQAGDELLSTLQGRRSGSQQILRVGALATLSRNFQLEFVQPLIGRSGIELVMRSGSIRELLTDLEAHELDVVLATAPVQRGTGSEVRCHLLRQQPISLVGRRRSRGRRFKFPDDLREVPVVLPGIESDIRIAFDRLLDQAGIVPTILAEVDDMAMLRLLARETEGVTLVPPIVVRDELAAGTLIEYCPVPELTESFYAIVQRRRFPNPLIGELLKHFRSAVA